MRQFALYIDEAVQGPFSEYEVQDMIHAGKVTAETLCAPAGSENWEPLANHFTFGSNLRLSRRVADKPPQAEDAEPPAPRLDPDIRRLLLMYGLADAASVDQVSPIQADILIRERETHLRRLILARRISTYVSLTTGAVTAWILLGNPSAIAMLGSVAESVAKPEAKAAARWENLCRRAKDHEASANAALAAPFGEPLGGMPAGPVLLSRLQVNEETAYNFATRVTLNSETLAGPLAKFGIALDSKVTLHLLGSDPTEDVLRKLRTQTETLQLVISPLLDNTQFEPLREELMSKFPDRPEIPESARLRADLGAIKVADLGMAIDKVLFRAREAEVIGEGRGVKNAATANPKAYASWAPLLRQFAGEIGQLRDRIRINVDPDARRKVWSEFNLGPGAELGAWVIAHAGRTMQTDEQGDVRLTETSNLRPEMLQRRALVSFRINDDTVFLPWDSAFLVIGETTSARISNETFLARERYKVVSLIETGGKRHVFRNEVGGKTLNLFRDSPRVRYLAVARERDTDVVTVRVSEEMFRAAKPGDVIPLETLAKLPVHATPAEPVSPASLTPETP